MQPTTKEMEDWRSFLP